MSKRKQIAFLVWEAVGQLAIVYMYGCIAFGASIDIYRWIFRNFINQP